MNYRCPKCYHRWHEPMIPHNNGACEDYHNDKEPHCHDYFGTCLDSIDEGICAEECEDAHD